MTEGETGVNSRHDVLGLVKDKGVNRAYFRCLVDSVLTDWGFIRGEFDFSADDDMICACYKGIGNRKIGATFLGDNVSEIMNYNFISGGVVDRCLVDPDEISDGALVFYNLPKDFAERLSADLEARLLE